MISILHEEDVIMVTTNELTELLQKIISQLSQPVTEEERRCGWDEETKLRWLKATQDDLKKLQLENFKEHREKEINLARELDFSGILKGELADLIKDSGRKWNEKYAVKPAWWWEKMEQKKKI